MTKFIPKKSLQYLLSYGLTQIEIGRILGVSQQVISYRVKKLREEYYSFRGEV